jgi:hypothetical protein
VGLFIFLLSGVIGNHLYFIKRRKVVSRATAEHHFNQKSLFLWKQVILKCSFECNVFSKNYLFIGENFYFKTLFKMLRNEKKLLGWGRGGGQINSSLLGDKIQPC